MTRYRSILRTLATTALLSIAVTACEKSSRVTTTAAGHPVTLRVTGPFSIDTQTNQTIIAYQQHRVTIERRRVLFDGALWANSPDGAIELLCLGAKTRSLSIVN